MKVLGFLGSPRLKGKCSTLLRKALEGAADNGAETKNFELIKYNIKYCMGCGNCFLKNPDLRIGACPLKDDAASILEEYLSADGYIFASPVYDVFVTALMKTFLERKIALTYKTPEEVGKIPAARPGVAANFKKKASFIVTGNCADEFIEVMGDPCFEAFEAHLLFEEIDTLDKLYVGGVENMTDAVFEDRLKKAYVMGEHLVKEIIAARG
jgi:putative NADPH-quinone reductase